MGWKNVKAHYGISQYVHVRQGDICISVLGPGNIIPVIRIDPEGAPAIVSQEWCNKGLSHLFEVFRREPETLRTLVEKPDHFERSIQVYTYEGSAILKTECEQLGWPNVTHDGRLMYVHCFSTDREQVVQWATEAAEHRVSELQKELDQMLNTPWVVPKAIADELVETRQQALNEARNSLATLTAAEV